MVTYEDMTFSYVADLDGFGKMEYDRAKDWEITLPPGWPDSPLLGRPKSKKFLHSPDSELMNLPVVKTYTSPKENGRRPSELKIVHRKGVKVWSFCLSVSMLGGEGYGPYVRFCPPYPREKAAFQAGISKIEDMLSKAEANYANIHRKYSDYSEKDNRRHTEDRAYVRAWLWNMQPGLQLELFK